MIFSIIYKILLLFCTVKSFNLGRKNRFPSQKYLFFYLLITFLVETLSFTLYFVDKEIKVGFLYHLYAVFSIMYFAYLYSKTNTMILNWSLISGGLSIFSIVLFHSFFSFDYDIKIGLTCSIFFIFNSILWFSQKLKSEIIEKISSIPYFWISTGLLLWSTFFIFRIIPMFYFSEIDPEFSDFLINMMHCINIIMYFLFYIALIKFNKI